MTRQPDMSRAGGIVLETRVSKTRVQFALKLESQRLGFKVKMRAFFCLKLESLRLGLTLRKPSFRDSSLGGGTYVELES